MAALNKQRNDQEEIHEIISGAADVDSSKCGITNSFSFTEFPKELWRP